MVFGFRSKRTASLLVTPRLVVGLIARYYSWLYLVGAVVGGRVGGLVDVAPEVLQRHRDVRLDPTDQHLRLTGTGLRPVNDKLGLLPHLGLGQTATSQSDP